MKKYSIISGSSFPIEIVLTDEQIKRGYHSGECSMDIFDLMDEDSIKEQTDKISDEELNEWWEEFYLDYKDKLNDDRETKLEWLIFECCSLAVDGVCTELL